MNKKFEKQPKKFISTSFQMYTAPESWSKYTTGIDINKSSSDQLQELLMDLLETWIRLDHFYACLHITNCYLHILFLCTEISAGLCNKLTLLALIRY